MSQSAPARSQRTYAGMIGAMLVAVVVAGGWYLIGKPNDSGQPVANVEWTPLVRAARTDAALLIYAPPALPAGWKARSVEYLPGGDPHWHLGTLTDKGRYVGIDEGRVEVSDLVGQYVDKNATQGKDVKIGAYLWQSWTDSGGDYALTRTVKQGALTLDSVVVVGHEVPHEEVAAFAASLRTGTINLRTATRAPAG